MEPPKLHFTSTIKYPHNTQPLKQNNAVNAVVAGNEVIFVQHGQRFVVPVENINEISCAADVRRRFGAAVLRPAPLWRIRYHNRNALTARIGVGHCVPDVVPERNRHKCQRADDGFKAVKFTEVV